MGLTIDFAFFCCKYDIIDTIRKNAALCWFLGVNRLVRGRKTATSCTYIDPTTVSTSGVDLGFSHLELMMVVRLETV
jgi:hypothetical protein